MAVSTAAGLGRTRQDRGEEQAEGRGGGEDGPGTPVALRDSSFSSAPDSNKTDKRGGWEDVLFADVCRVLDRLADPFLPPRDKLQ